jgi:hypothetical protein
MPRLREFAIVASAAMLVMAGAIGVQKLDPPTFASPLPAASAGAPVSSARDTTMHGTARFAGYAAVVMPRYADAMEQSASVAERVRAVVPRGLFGYFDMYLYVSKAASGPWAQHMYVFHETNDGDLRFEQSFPVSTGREMQEKYFTSTPAGLFELDPGRFDRNHYSHRWNNAPMPWAMFLNYTINDHPTGVALHSAIGHVAFLGHRASGGCVRMPPEKAEELFERIQATEAGRVPVFAMNGTTTDKTGRIALSADGTPLFTQGYKVLLIIEDYPGAPVVVAMLS